MVIFMIHACCERCFWSLRLPHSFHLLPHQLSDHPAVPTARHLQLPWCRGEIPCVLLLRTLAPWPRTSLPQTTHTVCLRWQRGMYRECTSMVKLACGFKHIFPKDTNRRESWDLTGLCHGDDICVVARRKQLQILGKVLEKRFEVKQTWHIGFSVSDAKELKILNRTIKIDVLNDEMTLEADTKLVKDALVSMKLTGAKGVDSPRARRNEEQTAQIENSEKLTSAGSTLYRSLVMKLAYVAQDSVDIAEAAKCLTRHMKEPRSGHMQELKRLGRYLVKNRRCALTYSRQTSEATLQAHVDSDWAGDLLGRKSTIGVIVKRSKHLLRQMWCLQSLVALSSRRSVHELGNSITLPRLDDRCPDTNLQWQFGSKECCKKTWNWRTTETLADTSLVVAEPGGTQSPEVGCCCGWAESSRHTHETIARSQDSRWVRTCWSKIVAAIMMTATANLRSTVWLRTSEQWGPSRRTRNARGRGSGHGVKCSNGRGSRKESGNVEERNDVMQLEWNASNSSIWEELTILEQLHPSCVAQHICRCQEQSCAQHTVQIHGKHLVFFNFFSFFSFILVVWFFSALVFQFLSFYCS